MLYIYLENDHEFSPVDFLEEMVNANIKPNRVTFQRLILQFCNQGKINEANRLMEDMENNKISVNEEMFSSLIWGHSINKYV